jgi:hypothetical protein
MPQMMLLIRPAQKGIIEFRPNDGRDSFHKQWLELTAKKKSLSLIHWKKPLPRMEGKHDWVKFIPTSCIKEIELFTLGYMNP